MDIAQIVMGVGSYLEIISRELLILLNALPQSLIEANRLGLQAYAMILGNMVTDLA
jgi:hypothetical protein